MKLTIDGNEKQVKNVLQAIYGSKEHNNTARILTNADGTVNHYHSEGCSEISRDSKKVDVTIETKNSGSNKLMSINELISLIRESDGTELITLKVLTN